MVVVKLRKCMEKVWKKYEERTTDLLICGFCPVVYRVTVLTLRFFVLTLVKFPPKNFPVDNDDISSCR